MRNCASAEVDLRFGRAQGLLGVVELGTRRPAVLQQLLLPAESKPRLGQRRLRRCEGGLGRAQRVLFVLGVEPGDNLACRNHVADAGVALDHASIETESEVDLVLGTDLAGEGNSLAVRTSLDRDRANGPRIGVRATFLLQPATDAAIRIMVAAAITARKRSPRRQDVRGRKC